MSPKFLFFTTSFVVGYVILSLELLGFRLLAPYFGYSLYVSGSLIGVVLLALSLGYLLGGHLSDNGSKDFIVYRFLSLSALYLFIVWFYSEAILSRFFELSLVYGSLLSAFTFFALPMILLAALSPYFIKLLTNDNVRDIGFSAGSIYAVSTIGSLVGTFLTSFYLVPTYGVSANFLSNIVLLFIVSFFWFRLKNKVIIFFAIALLFGFLAGKNSIGFASKVIAQTDSEYNSLEVVDYGNFYGLRADRRNHLVYSLYPKEGKWSGDYSFYHLFAIPPILNEAKTGILLGLGAGTLPYIHEEFNPDLKITGVEIDPKIVELGKKYFGLNKRTNTSVVIDDVRPYLAKDKKQYDLIEMDLFWGSGEIPFYLATKEFFSLIKSHLTQRGIVSINVYDPSEEKIISTPIQNTLASEFSYVYSVSFDRGSYFMLASESPLETEKLTEWLKKNESDPRFLSITERFLKDITPVFFNPEITIFTDDKAPLDILSYEAVFKNSKPK